MNSKSTEIAAKFCIKAMMTQDGQNGDQSMSTYDVDLWIHCDFRDEIMGLLHFDNDDTMMAVVPRLIASSKYMADARRNVGNQIEIPFSFFEGAGAMLDMMHNGIHELMGN
jgi:hypothetical protein